MPKGFFNEEELKEIVRGDEVKREKIVKTEYSCKECGLSFSCNSQKMGCFGEGRKGIMFIDEYPSEEDDNKGILFSGATGKFVKRILDKMELDLDVDCWYTTAINCRPNKKITPLHIMACKKHLMATIEKCKPKVIIPLGKTAMDSLVKHKTIGRMSGLSMADWVGSAIPDQEYKCWICPTWHPKDMYTNKFDEEKENPILRKQTSTYIKKAIKLADVPFYEANYFSECITITNVEEAIAIVKYMRKKSIIAFDYETTGKKPYREKHKIVAVSISDGMFSYSFPYFNNKSFRDAWLDLMKSDVGKIAHNAKFEVLWTKARGGYNNSEGCWPNNIVWDTMLAAHIINSIKKVNLKFQLYLTLGIAGYDASIDKYLSASEEDEALYGANAYNKIEEAPIDELLTYNAMDSLGTYKLYEHQNKLLSASMKKGQTLFVDGSIALSKAEYNGLPFDINTCSKINKRITRMMDSLEKSVFESKEMKKWDKDDPFRLSAVQDLPYLLYNKLGYKPDKMTKTGKPKADKDAMEQIDIPIVKDVMEWRRWSKVRDTYLVGFKRECVNDLIHPFFNLHTVQTFRSSSTDPNFQNIPKRDAEIAPLLRMMFKPRPGHKLGEYDYRAMEVCLDGETLIETIDGKRKLKDIVENFNKEDIYVYCYNDIEKRIGISKVINGAKTGKNKDTIKVTLDNGEDVICTPEHNFMLRNGEYKNANNLSIGESLMPFYSTIIKGKSRVNYKKINMNNGSHMLAHSLIALDVFGVTIKGSSLVKKLWWEERKKEKNHKVIKIEKHSSMDVYNITVDKFHNFALSSGIIVKNCTIACYNKDPTLIKFITEEHDMHREIASQLVLKEPNDINKKERYVAKNGFVFPTFYGSYYKNTGVQIWNELPIETITHLKTKGIRNVDDMISHVKDVEDDFWFNRFPVAYEYKEKVLSEYDKNGYVDLKTGFRCYGPMTRNQILNCPVQGSAFHCLLWTFTRLTKRLEKLKMDTKLIGQIHDATVPDILPEEEEEFDYLIWLYGTQKIREYWDWLIVPLGIEKSISKVDGNWSEMEEVGILTGE